jgi:hypothetical protein
MIQKNQYHMSKPPMMYKREGLHRIEYIQEKFSKTCSVYMVSFALLTSTTLTAMDCPFRKKWSWMFKHAYLCHVKIIICLYLADIITSIKLRLSLDSCKYIIPSLSHVSEIVEDIIKYNFLVWLNIQILLRHEQTRQVCLPWMFHTS